MSKIINGVASEYDMPMKYEDKKTTVFIDTQDIEERHTEELYKEYLEKENKALKEVIKKCYTSEEIDFEIMLVKAELQAEKDINNNLHKTIDKLRVNLYETQQQLDLYKEIMEEAREYIKRHIRPEYRNGRDNEFYLELNQKELKALLQIFDKSKGEEDEYDN